VREFAFWLRDLRSQSGLTYAQLARSARFATSTMQDAARGQRLPTLAVVKAFVAACGGDLKAWEAYWSQIKRLVDRHVPADVSRSVEPPWTAGPGGAGRPSNDSAEGWYVESLSALLRLDADPIEAVEQRVIVATVDNLAEIASAISVPRDHADSGPAHGLDVELLHGGLLERREQPYESFFRNVISLPRPLRAGERHAYAISLRIPPGQPMAAHYVHTPLQRSDYFEVRVRFGRDRLPPSIWKLDGVPTGVIYGRQPASEVLTPDRSGEVHLTFRDLRQGLSYGLSWSAAP
jgi:transcriptional regulator with XRE-family HTH domain